MKNFFLALCIAALAFLNVVASAETYTTAAKDATAFTKAANTHFCEGLHFDDWRDFEAVQHGLVAREKGFQIKSAPDATTTIINMALYDAFIPDAADVSTTSPFTWPPTVNPSLWRHAILNKSYGLFEVAGRPSGENIYQVRGYDMSNITFIEGDTGFVVVDPLTVRETAAAAVELFYKNLPESKRTKTIHTIIYTHSHVDHYGGAQGILNSAHTRPDCRIIAPTGFWEAAVTENVTVGSAMQLRGTTMYGVLLIGAGMIGEKGHVDNGLGKTFNVDGHGDLIKPHFSITADGQTETIDGLTFEFILAANTEAPAEMVFYIQEYESLCLAEICNRTFHNTLTPRGAVVRDLVAWSNALDKMRTRWPNAQNAWGPHTWPQWGTATISDYIYKQSLAYRFLHDHTVYLLNHGFDMFQIAEMLKLPAPLNGEWFNRGYYGTVHFNCKAVYQKYLGWFDNNPATLWKYAPEQSATRYVKYIPAAGGDIVKAAEAAYADGEYRWVVEVLEHVRLSTPSNTQALYLQADAFEQLAYQAESAVWRNYFMAGAYRNRIPAFAKVLSTPIPQPLNTDLDTADVLRTLTTNINGAADEAAAGSQVTWAVTELDGTTRYFSAQLDCSVLWIRETDTAPAGGMQIAAPRTAIDQAITAAGADWLQSLLSNAAASGVVADEATTAALHNLYLLTLVPPGPVPSTVAEFTNY